MNKQNEETTKGDSSEPIVSWSGVQGETQGEDVDIPKEDEVTENEPQPTPAEVKPAD